MANKDRHKRSARKARALERKQLEERRAASAPAADSKKAEPAKSSKKTEPKKKGKVALWFGEVRKELHRVTWPTKSEMKNYTIAVIAMLIIFGVAVWLVDTGVVAALVGYSGLRG